MGCGGRGRGAIGRVGMWGERERCYRKGWDVGERERCYRKGWDVGTGRGRGAIGRVGMWGEGEVL